jgi:hypothetical protein
MAAGTDLMGTHVPISFCAILKHNIFMYPQHLPYYTHNFESFSGWSTVESEHYTFHYTEGSVAERDIQHIQATQEAAFKKILTTLRIPPPNRKIEYFFYPTPQVKTELMGDDWFAQSIYNEFRIHVLYTTEDKPIGAHEDTHLLSLPWGISWNFLQEGLAEYMVGYCWDGVLHNQKVLDGLKKGLVLSPMNQLSSTDWLTIPDEHIIYYYALAGSWSSFLIETYGMEKYRDFYMSTKREMSAEKILALYATHFEKELAVLEREYFTTLNT